MFKAIRFAALAAGASLLAVPALAAGSPLVGSWDTVAKTDFGEFKAVVTVTEAGDSYAIDVKDVPIEGAPPAPPAPPGAITDIVVDGANFSFKRKLTTPQGDIELAYKGTVDGDTLTAEVNSQFGTIPVTGTRQ
jgi:hypothetical protein